MRIKIINPNSSREMTRRIDDIAKKYKRAGTDITTVSCTNSPPSIDSHHDAVFASVPILEEVRSGLKEGFDGFVIACFGDPALEACRELSEVPVVGMAEAAMLLVCTVAYRFSVVSLPENSLSEMSELVRRYGLEHRCASIRMINAPVLETEEEPAKIRSLLAEESRRAVGEDKAEAILLGCAGFGGLDKELEAEIGVPVIDGVVASVKILESLYDYGLKTSKALSYRKPREWPP